MVPTEREQIIKLTNSLVEIPSVSGNKEESLRALNLVDEYLGEHKYIVSRTFESKGIVSRVWGDPESLMNPNLLLNGHIDVVSPDSLKQFAPVEKDGQIIGRGAGDMKGQIASMLFAYKEWINNNNSSRGVSLLLTSDEEIGGFNGARYVVEKEGLRANIVFIPDGSDAFQIVDSQKAPHHFHIKATGTGGHASLAFKIENPVDKIVRLYGDMQRKYALASKDDPWKSTFEMTVINTGGNSANKIPSEVDAWFSWRWPLEQIPFSQGVEEMKRLSSMYGCEYLTDEHGFGEGCLIEDKNALFVSRWKAIMETELKEKIDYTKMHGATDGRHFYKYGAQVLVTNAKAGGTHSSNEWVDIDSLVVLAHALYNYQQEMTRAK
jgi:succinyl-diaminopimelate desuccinylase